jgi:hypothetical protein
MEGQWVSVTERLPDELQTVLVFEGLRARGAIRETRLWCDFVVNGRWHGPGVITHWMPLPEPPTK